MESDKSLLKSAKEFLVESLCNHHDRKCNFAILHAVTATELVLKERLAKIHPTLIFKNIDSANFLGGLTISLNIIPQRLVNLGVPLESTEIELISTFAKWRNQIVHHMPLFEEESANKKLPRLLNFLAVFLRRELDTPLEEFLPISLYRIALNLLNEWNRVVSMAQTNAQAEGGVLSEACPDCGAVDVLCLREEKRVYCQLCNSENYRYDQCVQCGRKTMIGFSSFDEGNYCDRCINAAGESYMQMLIDIERGK